MNKILAICLIFVVSLLIFKGCQNSKQKSTIEQLSSLRIDDILTLKHYKDDNDRLHTLSQELTIDKLVMEQEVANLAKQLKIKPKQIKGETIYSIDVQVTKQVDTFYKDAWVEIERKTNDSIRVSMKDTLIQTRYWKRKWFLAPKQSFVDISNASPYVKITGIKSLELKPKSPTFIIGPSINYDAINKTPSIGFSLLYFPLTLKF